MSGVLVATCGNCHAGDDAFGPRVGSRLRESNPAGVEVRDLDIKPAALFDHLPGPDCLVLVDAVRMPWGDPGRLIQVDLIREELPALLNDDAMSSHGLGLAHQLALARQLDLLPEQVWLVGAVLESTESEAAASPWMADAVDAACGKILEIADCSAEV